MYICDAQLLQYANEGLLNFYTVASSYQKLISRSVDTFKKKTLVAFEYSFVAKNHKW